MCRCQAKQGAAVSADADQAAAVRSFPSLTNGTKTVRCNCLLGGWHNGVKERASIRALIAKLRHKGSAVAIVNSGAASLVP